MARSAALFSEGTSGCSTKVKSSSAFGMPRPDTRSSSSISRPPDDAPPPPQSGPGTLYAVSCTPRSSGLSSDARSASAVRTVSRSSGEHGASNRPKDAAHSRGSNPVRASQSAWGPPGDERRNPRASRYGPYGLRVFFSRGARFGSTNEGTERATPGGGSLRNRPSWASKAAIRSRSC